jgi:large subunit ribosomal protein L5
MGAVQQEIWRDRLMAYIPRLKKYYRDNVIPAMKKRFNYPNVMMVPRLEKIVVNVGMGEASQNPKLLDSVSEEVGLITGLKPALTRAKKSISNFKLRQGMPVGCFVTLRRNHMYEFLDRLINVAIPRIRDFRGLSDRSFDGRGNYSLGIREQIIFPEIDYDKIDKIRGMDITIVTTAKTDEEALELLREFGVPFRKRAESETTTEAA